MSRTPWHWRNLIAHASDHDPQQSSLAPDRLTLWALVYLAVPNVLFIFGWIEVLFAIPLALLLGFAIYRIGPVGPAAGADSRTSLVLLVLAATWAALGGAGHFFFANPDWLIRDAVLGDLVFGEWPVSYGQDAGLPLLLRSAIGYFLPAAAVAKSLGIQSADLALYLWTVLGVLLFLRLLPLALTRGPLLALLCLVTLLFSGMDFLGILFKYGHLPPFPYRLEWWVPYSYTSLSGQLFWAPNHALPMWLFTALFYRHWAHADFPRLALVGLPLTLIWTPFAAVGMMPFMALATLRWWRRQTPLRMHPLQVAFALLTTYLMLRFLTMDIALLPVRGAAASGPASATAATHYSPGNFDYLMFVAMEFGLLALAMLPLLRNSYGLYAMSVAVLLLLPIYGVGPSNDSMLRLSIPPLIIILILILRFIQGAFAQRRWPVPLWVMGIVLLFGAPTPLFEISRALLWKRIPPDYTRTLLETQHGLLPAHYVAHLNRGDVALWLREPRQMPARSQD